MAQKLQDVGVLFDLDGTLLDTSPDLLQALDAALAQNGLPPCNHAKHRNYINGGSQAIVENAIQEKLSTSILKKIENDFLAEYAACIGRETHFYVGMDILLDWLDIERIPWGIVTNKPARFTRAQIKMLELERHLEALISGDSCTEAKPSSKPLFLAAQHLGTKPENTYFLGDHIRDAESAKAAGMFAVAVSWGFRTPDEDIDAWGADFVIDEPEEMLDIIQKACQP
jgi:2-phosphoglycolate phosphatase